MAATSRCRSREARHSGAYGARTCVSSRSTAHLLVEGSSAPDRHTPRNPCATPSAWASTRRSSRACARWRTTSCGEARSGRSTLPPRRSRSRPRTARRRPRGQRSRRPSPAPASRPPAPQATAGCRADVPRRSRVCAGPGHTQPREPCESARLCRAWCHSMICVRGSALHLKAAEGVLGAHRREVGRVLAGGEMKAV